MLMNCMGQGAAATLVGGIRIADWALAITVLLLGLLVIIAVVAVIRTIAALWRGRSLWRRSVRLADPTGPDKGTLT